MRSDQSVSCDWRRRQLASTERSASSERVVSRLRRVSKACAIRSSRTPSRPPAISCTLAGRAATASSSCRRASARSARGSTSGIGIAVTGGGGVGAGLAAGALLAAGACAGAGGAAGGACARAAAAQSDVASRNTRAPAQRRAAVGWSSPREGIMSQTIAPFRISASDAELDELRRRLRATRWPERETVSDWSQGIPLAYVQEVCTYWAEKYDWRAREARLNAFPQFRTEIDGLGIYFIHVRSPHEGALPIVLTHGWPGSVVEFHKVIGPLADPTAHGGSAADAFHVVC